MNRCVGVALVATPDSPHREGSLQFQLFGPDRTHFLNYVRTIGVTREGGRWRFDSSGEPQPFEDLDAYETRRIQDRLSADLIAKYCAALGFSPFDKNAYGGAVLVSATPPARGELVSLARRQSALGIEGESPCHGVDPPPSRTIAGDQLEDW